MPKKFVNSTCQPIKKSIANIVVKVENKTIRHVYMKKQDQQINLEGKGSYKITSLHTSKSVCQCLQTQPSVKKTKPMREQKSILKKRQTKRNLIYSRFQIH